jgi:hypothetical protein
MRLLKLMLVVGAVFAVAVVSWAGPVVAPSFLGPSGALLTPNTEVNDLNTVDVGGHVMLIDPGDSTLTIVKANICVLKKLEITPTYVSLDADTGNEQVGGLKSDGYGGYHHGLRLEDLDEFTVSAKYQIWREPASKLGFAIGAIDLAGQIYPNIPYYMVASKTCNKIVPGQPWRWNWGVAFGTSDVFFVNEPSGCGCRHHHHHGNDKDDSHFFTSLEAGVADWCALVAEVGEQDFNYGARFVPVKNLRIDVASVSLYNDSQFVVGASYHITF